MISYTELDKDQFGNFRIQGSATLNDGTIRVFGTDADRDKAYEIARIKSERAERTLAAMEVHDPEDLEHFRQAANLDLRILKAPDGTLVEATGATVGALLAAGYEEHEDQSAPPQRSNEHAGPVEVGARGSTRTRRKKPADEMDD